MWMPIRISTACWGSPVLCSCKALWMAAAARTAATVLGKEIRKPSPKDLCTRPPNSLTWSSTIAACNPRMSSASRSPRARRSAVERTTSVIMTVSSLAARLLPDKGYLPVELAAQRWPSCSAPICRPRVRWRGGQPPSSLTPYADSGFGVPRRRTCLAFLGQNDEHRACPRSSTASTFLHCLNCASGLRGNPLCHVLDKLGKSFGPILCQIKPVHSLGETQVGVHTGNNDACIYREKFDAHQRHPNVNIDHQAFVQDRVEDIGEAAGRRAVKITIARLGCDGHEINSRSGPWIGT